MAGMGGLVSRGPKSEKPWDKPWDRPQNRGAAHGWETEKGVDKVKLEPRCYAASRFANAHDPTGEIGLKHWIREGQLKDSLHF